MNPGQDLNYYAEINYKLKTNLSDSIVRNTGEARARNFIYVEYFI